MRQVWRVIERIATNRIRKGHPLGNTLMGIEHESMDIKGGSDWVGHHALEWSRAGGNRRMMLNGCIRPCEDWAPPQDPWYRALRAEVADRYGPALGEPPEDAVPTASGLLPFPPAG